MKEWFEGKRYVQPIDYRPWWLDVLYGLASIAVVVLIIASLSGCATQTTFNGHCAMQAVGSRGDVAFMRVYCEADE